MCFSKNLSFVPKLSFNLFLYIFYLKKILYMNSCSNVHMKETPVCEIESVNHEAVEYVTKQLCSDDEIYRFTELFKVLATPSRLKILFALQHHELCVCDLAIVLNTTTSSVSHQLRILRQNSLVKFRKEGKNVYYSLVNKSFVESILNNHEWFGLEHSFCTGE